MSGRDAGPDAGRRSIGLVGRETGALMPPRRQTAVLAWSARTSSNTGPTTRSWLPAWGTMNVLKTPGPRIAAPAPAVSTELHEMTTTISFAPTWTRLARSNPGSARSTGSTSRSTAETTSSTGTLSLIRLTTIADIRTPPSGAGRTIWADEPFTQRDGGESRELLAAHTGRCTCASCSKLSASSARSSRPRRPTGRRRSGRRLRRGRRGCLRRPTGRSRTTRPPSSRGCHRRGWGFPAAGA